MTYIFETMLLPVDSFETYVASCSRSFSAICEANRVKGYYEGREWLPLLSMRRFL